MKKYISRSMRWLTIFTIISLFILLIGIVLVVTNSPNDGIKIGLTLLGSMMSVVFLSCFFAEKSRYLTIDSDKIVLPRGVDKNGKIVLKRTIIKLSQITSISSKLYKGDRLFSKNTYFYTLKLKDGTKITFTLYAYGKEAENKIVEVIKNSI